MAPRIRAKDRARRRACGCERQWRPGSSRPSRAAGVAGSRDLSRSTRALRWPRSWWSRRWRFPRSCMPCRAVAIRAPPNASTRPGLRREASPSTENVPERTPMLKLRSTPASLVHLAPFSLLAVACSQAPGTEPVPVAATIAQDSATPSTAAAPAASAAPPADEWPAAVPPEPFHDPEKNFEAAKKALLEGYYRDSLTEADLYRGAVAGMLEQADPAMHKGNKPLSPSDVGERRQDLLAELGGIGVMIELGPA